VDARFVRSSARLSACEGRILAYPWWKVLLTLFDLAIYNIRLMKTLRRERVAVLWCSNIRCFLMAVVAAHVLHVPIVWNIWAERRFGRATRFIYDLCFRAADLVVTEYLAQADGLFSPKLVARHKGRLKTVYTGIDDDYYTYPGTGLTNPEHEPSTIVGCSRICSAKGLNDIISALDILKRRGRRVNLKVVGAALTASDRAFQHALLRRIDGLQLTDEVEICGWQEDVKPFLSLADIFVSASFTEGLPGAVREAQAMGKPVVGTDVGGTREAIADRETGILVPPGNPVALADALEGLLARPDVLKRMSAAAKVRARRLFTIDAYVKEYSLTLSCLL
jgi:glycosyltransferase involved in cell wall biosynthesis